MFKKLFGAFATIAVLVGYSSIVGYGLEAGKDSYRKRKEKQTKKDEWRN